MADRPAELAVADAALADGPPIGDFVALLKPRVMSLVVFTALVGLAAAPATLHPVLAAVAVLCIALGAGAAGAINMWYERDIDALMARTCDRPLPAGRMDPGAALGFGVLLAAGSVSVMALAVNWTSAALLAAAIAFYVFVYTVWLKRRTHWNVVIGGAAGALPPAIGWAAASGEIGAGAVALFALIFVWTPPHSWALALCRQDEYRSAGIPMLPVAAGEAETRRRIFLYALLLVPVSFAPCFAGVAGAAYAAAAAALGSAFLVLAWRLRRGGGAKRAQALFGFSIVYLAVLFAAVLAERLAGGGGA